MSNDIGTEPELRTRIAVVERDLTTLTTDVRDLMKVVRDLATTVTEAKAPRRVDWFPLVGAAMSAIVLIMAIGSAVIVPLNGEVNALKATQYRQRDRFDTHSMLPLHPVGASKVENLERLSLLLTEQLRQNLETLTKQLAAHVIDERHENEIRDTATKREIELTHAVISTRVADLDMRLQKEFGLIQDRNNSRLAKLEVEDIDSRRANDAELRQWRLRAILRDAAPKP